ncbi:MAG: NUDIX hydrolase [Actinomycetota bacterium]|nr:MAG: ADP-ribose [Actinomycetota bacterium]MDO8949249.1 NUDIX hydrolase [Actinomycetota bacterium]MDP3629650.1 NUDIX hydrolase [Actinomycetota bacterium]
MTETEYPKPAMSGDTVVVRRHGRAREVLLIRRGREPFANAWALPGGFLEPFERPEDAARRELAEETGLRLHAPFTLVGVYGEAGRDPRGWTVSVSYVVLLEHDAPTVTGGDDAAEARWFPIGELPPLAFDHDRIVSDALVLLG